MTLSEAYGGDPLVTFFFFFFFAIVKCVFPVEISNVVDPKQISVVSKKL